MNRPVHFEITAVNPERASKFYSDVFGWKFTKYDGAPGQDYWFIETGDKSAMGIDGGLMRREGPPTFAMEVMSLDDHAMKITRAGGEQVVPKFAIPGMGWVAYFKDTEGTIFGVWQTDAEAR